MPINSQGRSSASAARRTPGGIQVIARAARVLRAIEDRPDGLSLGQIAKRVGLARSTVQRIVGALSAEGFVAANGHSGGVRIGPGLIRLAASAGSSTPELIAPYLRTLGEQVGETVDLAVLSGGSAMFVDQVQGKQRLVALSAVGERFPLHCTANGKAILACFAGEDTDDLIAKSLEEHKSHGLRNRRTLLREIEQVRRSHLAYDLGEHGEGINAVGTALLDAFGRPLAISIPVPAQRFAQQKPMLERTLLNFREQIKKLLFK
ncbi:IclR family transcriptional regulator [Roseiarcaceae bacterium H3SJ34-1]|uniref:IclR family transcriptional regulator n=1 Tax=Terripilifer ovatus TaxID=3032367 RepID=UPI003AB98C2C|nr:IclR family transcriptional regulator [Roseiarcaceae bacterium H3SJ34-1]